MLVWFVSIDYNNVYIFGKFILINKTSIDFLFVSVSINKQDKGLISKRSEDAFSGTCKKEIFYTEI